MHILSTVARSITSRSLARVEQIQSNHGTYARFFTCSCSLCGAEAPRPSEDGMHHSRLTLPGSGPVIVEHSKGGVNQAGASESQAVQGPAPNPNPPPKPKLLSRPRAGAPAPRWKRNSLTAQARAGKWGGFHQEQGAPASGHVVDGGLVACDGHWSNVDPVVEGNLELGLETSLSKNVGDNSEEVGAKEVPPEVLIEQPVLSNPQHGQNAASISTSKRGKERTRAVPRTRSRSSGPRSAARSGTGSWGNFFEDIERSDPEITMMTGSEEEADAPAPSRSTADDTASSSAYVSSEWDATYGTNVYPEPTPDLYEDILPLPSRPHEPNASKAEDIPALSPRAGPGFITQAEAAALIDRLSHQRRKRRVPTRNTPGLSPGEAESRDSSTQRHPDQHQPAVQEDMTIMSRQQALYVLLQEPVEPVPRDINEQEHATIKEGRRCHSDIVSADQRLTEQLQKGVWKYSAKKNVALTKKHVGQMNVALQSFAR
ncbi:hypothetical protein CTAM01_09732 [Colletotrichum tamarilloi]|uniref:Uncharacterized protein n=1 Tax=Colletotrichum tamarilloi TaxID=1209934 RepID=A0ABQ9R2G7_9PEZI|nr:uncharacterized protein CTAM01_09732 [Colletotrichum tamarilloi]KAK1492781.1 hypothetical protein CTAM01_09732 [Colletotrichum tamarilloi]